MWKLLKYLKAYLKESICAPLFKVLEVCFELIVPLVIASVIDKGIGDGGEKANIPYIFTMCGVLVLLAVVGLACTLVAQYFAAKASVGFCTDIRSALFKHISRLSYSQQEQVRSSTLITRLTGDINQVQTGLNLTLRLVLRSPFVVFGAMLMAFIVDSKAAIIFAIVIPILAVIIFAIMLVSIPLYKATQQALDKVLCKTNESLKGVRVIRAFCKEEDDISELNEKNSFLYNMQIKAGKISSLLNPVTVVIINCAIAVLIYNGALRVNSGSLSQGEVVALYNYMTQILIELIKLANLIINITKSIACGNRIQAVFDTAPAIVSGSKFETSSSDYAIELENVSFSYSENADSAISDINLKIKSGITFGIIGPTGSGKSTLINLLPRFYEASFGSVKLFGEDIKNFNLETLRDLFGIVPQRAVLFKGTLRDNMKISVPDATDEEIFKALETAQALDFVLKKGNGLDFVIEQGGKNLSGGQRQRLNIARALVRKPKILILDDSSSALDYATDASLRNALKNLDFETTVIIVSQRASALRHADLIAVMDNGKVIATGTDFELYNSCELYNEIRSTQFAESEGA